MPLFGFRGIQPLQSGFPLRYFFFQFFPTNASFRIPGNPTSPEWLSIAVFFLPILPDSPGPKVPKPSALCEEFHPSCLFLNLHGPSLLFFPSGESFDVVSFDVNGLSLIVTRQVTIQEKSANQSVHWTPTPALFMKFCGRLSVHLY